MARDDWFRNSDWNDAIEEAFFEKLRRARNKAQYLRIQAGTLAEKHPRVALRLSDQYLLLGDHFDVAQAHVDRASAYLSLGQIEEAIQSYEEALGAESRHPSLKTSAYILLPFVIATQRLNSRYALAMQILDQHRTRLMFPIDHFQWHATRALIANDLGDTAEARKHAHRALEQAAADHSGFRYHAALGIVGDGYKDLREQLARIT